MRDEDRFATSEREVLRENEASGFVVGQALSVPPIIRAPTAFEVVEREQLRHLAAP